MPQGVYGEFSKITEEVAELLDANSQNCAIMVIMEISDIVGALYAHYGIQYVNECYDAITPPEECNVDNHKSIENDVELMFGFLTHNPTKKSNLIACIHLLAVWLDRFNLSFIDAKAMADITQRAFINGHR